MSATAALSALSATGPRQVLVSGRAVDAVSGRGIDGADLTLTYDAAGDGRFAALPARLGRHDDGWFSFAVVPDQWAAPPPATTPVLRVSAVAPGYADAAGELAVGAASLAIDRDSRIVAGQPVTVSRLHDAPLRLDVTLDPLAVALEGVVLRGGDPDRPASAATVAVVAPPGGASAVTDAGGAFRIDALPVAPAITVRVSHQGQDRDEIVRPDFSQRINRAVFATA